MNDALNHDDTPDTQPTSEPTEASTPLSSASGDAEEAATDDAGATPQRRVRRRGRGRVVASAGDAEPASHGDAEQAAPAVAEPEAEDVAEAPVPRPSRRLRLPPGVKIEPLHAGAELPEIPEFSRSESLEDISTEAAGEAASPGDSSSDLSDVDADSDADDLSDGTDDSDLDDDAEGEADSEGQPAGGEDGEGDEGRRRRRRRRGGRRHRRRRREDGDTPAAAAEPAAGGPRIEVLPGETLSGEAVTGDGPTPARESRGDRRERGDRRGDRGERGPERVGERGSERGADRGERPDRAGPRGRGERNERNERGERSERSGPPGAERNERGNDRGRRGRGGGRRGGYRNDPDGVVQGHSSGWSTGGPNLDEAILADREGGYWGTDGANAGNAQEPIDEAWTELNDELAEVEGVEAAPDEAELSSDMPGEHDAAGDDADASDASDDSSDNGDGDDTSDSAAQEADSAVLDAATDVEGEVIKAPAPLSRDEEDEEEEGLGDKVMLINVAEHDECRIGILDADSRLDELYTERVTTASHVGNIYKGIVTNVESSIQAAFVDIGLEKAGFLHISDLQPQYFMRNRQGKPVLEDVGRKLARRDRPPIQSCLRRGQEVIVQIIKEGIGNKGPTLTSYVSIPGRYLVLMPGMTRLGVSRKVMDDNDRRSARRKLEQLRPPENLGFIIRTQGVGRSQKELERDLDYLMRLWDAIDKRIHTERGPSELFRESDLVIRTLRDIYSRSIGKIVVDSEDVAARAREFLGIVDPDAAMAVEYYREKTPLFHRYGIEEEITRIYDRHVPLPSGGSLVIDATEALVAIDVNSGKSRQQQDAEETALRTNKEAAVEIARQLRLRDLGGVIICDFIDMRHERHRQAVERCLLDAMKKDRARAKILPISRFGIIEMTRQRMRPSLKRTIFTDCPHCRGSGFVKRAESLTLDVLRMLRQVLAQAQVHSVTVSVHPDVASRLLNLKRRQLVRLEIESSKSVTIQAVATFGPDQCELTFFDGAGRGRLVEEEMLFGRFRGPVRTTPVGPIGMPIKKAAITGPKIVGFDENAETAEGSEADGEAAESSYSDLSGSHALLTDASDANLTDGEETDEEAGGVDQGPEDDAVQDAGDDGASGDHAQAADSRGSAAAGAPTPRTSPVTTDDDDGEPLVDRAAGLVRNAVGQITSRVARIGDALLHKGEHDENPEPKKKE